VTVGMSQKCQKRTFDTLPNRSKARSYGIGEWGQSHMGRHMSANAMIAVAATCRRYNQPFALLSLSTYVRADEVIA